MSFAVGLGAGLACGIGCGISGGQKKARTQIEEHMEALLDSGEIRLLDADDRPIPIRSLLDDALATRLADKRTILLVVLLLAGLAALGGVVFLLLLR